MKLSPITIVLLFACVACAAVMRPGPGPASAQSFVALEDNLSQGLAASDARNADALLDDDFVFVSPDGRVTHKAERLAALSRPAVKAGAPLASHNDSVEVQHQDAHFAVVIVRSTWRIAAAANGEHYVATHVWIRRANQWRLLSAQVARSLP
jgi:hypothetical protein